MAETIANGLDSATATVEQILAPMGLMEGDNAVAKRMAFGAVVGGAVVSFFKPSGMFDEAGNARPWSLQVGQNYTGPTPTSFPWWTASVVGAFIFGTLI
jgi:hypothetical protein